MLAKTGEAYKAAAREVALSFLKSLKFELMQAFGPSTTNLTDNQCFIGFLVLRTINPSKLLSVKVFIHNKNKQLFRHTQDTVTADSWCQVALHELPVQRNEAIYIQLKQLTGNTKGGVQHHLSATYNATW